MSTLSKILQIAVLACIVLLQQACVEDDEKTGSILSGEWYGDFGMCYDHTYINHRGDTITETYFSSETHIIFYPKHGNRYSDSGDGYQCDFYRYGPYERKFYCFDWHVNNGIISLNYIVDSELSTDILDYRIDERMGIFIGRFAGSDTRFTLHKVADYLNWDELRDIYWMSVANDANTEVFQPSFSIEGNVVNPWNRFATPRE